VRFYFPAIGWLDWVLENKDSSHKFLPTTGSVPSPAEHRERASRPSLAANGASASKRSSTARLSPRRRAAGHRNRHPFHFEEVCCLFGDRAKIACHILESDTEKTGVPVGLSEALAGFSGFSGSVMARSRRAPESFALMWG